MTGDQWLRPERVPRWLWGISAQELLSSAWKRRIRPGVLKEAKDGRCTRCGAPHSSIVHEEWEYDQLTGVATMVGLAPICTDCHAVVHVDQIPIEYHERAVQHLATTNGITLDEARALVNDAIAAEEEGFPTPWSVAVSSEIVSRFPEMALLPERAVAKLPNLPEQLRDYLRSRSGSTPRDAA